MSFSAKELRLFHLSDMGDPPVHGLTYNIAGFTSLSIIFLPSLIQRQSKHYTDRRHYFVL